jgi:GTP-dependent phosphoenolpyruvate carboxykinase
MTEYTPDQQRVADWLVNRTQHMVGAGDDPIGFLLASYEHVHAELVEVRKLRTLCEQFVQDQRIYCPESIYQTDRVIQNAYEFIEKVCDIVGYLDTEDEDDE